MDQFNLHGGEARKSPVALLLIDVINDMEFEEGKELLKQALPAARKIAALKRRARASGIPVIYVNDNFGRWQSDFKKQVQHCLKDKVCGEPVARPHRSLQRPSSVKVTPAARILEEEPTDLETRSV